MSHIRKLYAATIVTDRCILVSPDLRSQDSMDIQDMDLHHILPQIRVSDFGDVVYDESDTGTSSRRDSDLLVEDSSSSINGNMERLRLPGLGAPNLNMSFSSNVGFSLFPAESADPSQEEEEDSLPSLSPLSPSRSPSPSPHSEQWWSGKYDFAAKVIVLGDFGVGKSTLLKSLSSVHNLPWCRCLSFRPNEYLEMECRKNEKKVLIRIVDTGGQERFRSMTSSYFRGAHGCLLMFNVTKEESFNNVINWYNDLGIYAQSDNVSAIVVGAFTSSPTPQAVSPTSSTPMNVPGRVVSAERAFRLAESLGLTYCETNVTDSQTALWILTRLVNNVIISRARRQSLAITIMPSLQGRQSIHLDDEDRKKKKWKCCTSS